MPKAENFLKIDFLAKRNISKEGYLLQTQANN